MAQAASIAPVQTATGVVTQTAAGIVMQSTPGSVTQTAAGVDHVWIASLDRKKDELNALLQVLERKRRKRPLALSTIPVITLDEAIRNNSLDSFQFAVQSIAAQFAQKKITSLLAKYLYPGLDHVRFFSSGIASATQNAPTAALVWGLLLIVIQCGCIFAESVEEIIGQLGALQGLLPYLQKDVSLYPQSKALEYHLRTIFEDYIDFCMVIIRHIARGPMWMLLGIFASSSLRHNLQGLKTRLKEHVANFDRAVESAERARAILADDRMQRSQTQLIAFAHASHASQVFQSSQTLHNNVQIPHVSQSFQSLPASHAPHALLPAPPPMVTQAKLRIHSVNIAKNDDFIGRERELDMLHDWLIRRHTSAKPASCGIHGIGGVGKTEIALRFTSKYEDIYDHVFWVTADPQQEEETLRVFGNIGRQLGLFDVNIVEDSCVDKVLDWLQTEDHRWLLVFDNVVDWKSVARYWPMKAKRSSAIVLTSQKLTPWTDHQVELLPLEDQAGCDLLLRQLRVVPSGPKDPICSIAREISQELGGSPLYLTHAQGFMSLSGCTPADYLSIIRTVSNPLDWNSNSMWRYGRAASTTHDRMLKELSNGATSLLFMLTFMNPDDVDEDLLLNHEFECLDFLRDRATYLSYIAELSEGRLVWRGTDGTREYLRMHRATQAAMLQKLNRDLLQRDTSFSQVIHLLRANLPDPSAMAKLQIAEAHAWPHISRVLPHLLRAFNCFERSKPPMQGDMFFAQLLSDVANMDLYDRGGIADAYRINKKVEAILQSLGYPQRSRLMSDALVIIGLCTDFMALSKRQEGLEVRQRCVDIRRHCFSEIAHDKVTLDDKIWLYNSYTDLVCSKQQTNDFDHARAILEDCFEQYKQWGTEEDIPYEYSKYYNQMAYVLLHENNSQKAVEYAKKGYELVAKATPGAQVTVLYKFDYANILFQHGDGSTALVVLRDLLETCERDCGKENVRTLEVQLNIGIICYFLGDLDSAEIHIGKALEKNKRDLWPIENITRAKYYLSQVLKARDPQDQRGLDLEADAKAALTQLLAVDLSGGALEHHDNMPMLFDYLVHWECRLITPRQK